RLDRCPYLRPDGADLVDVLDDEDNGRDEGDEGENDPRRWAGELGGIESPLSRRHDLRRDGHGLGDDTVGEPGRLSRGERRALSNEGPGDADQGRRQYAGEDHPDGLDRALVVGEPAGDGL